MRIVALIPARAGSKRIPGKNTKLLGGKPLIQWAIEAARDSGIFERVIVSTEDSQTIEIAGRVWNGAWTHARLPEHARDDSSDIEWVRDLFGPAATAGRTADVMEGIDAFAILRPTSPFRTAATIRRAVEQFKTTKCSSIRAVERVKQHPFKMWEHFDFMNSMKPLVEGYDGDATPWHSMPTQSLQHIYVQNSSLEIAHRWCVDIFDSISGPKVAPFFTEGMEGFSIDYPEDWERAERHVAALQAPPPA